MAYKREVIERFENPTNVGSFDPQNSNVGTGVVGAPACGDVMKLQIVVDDNGIITDVAYKAFGCVAAVASSDYAASKIKNVHISEAEALKNTEIVESLGLPPVKIHCSVLAEEAIKAAVSDFKNKRSGAG